MLREQVEDQGFAIIPEDVLAGKLTGITEHIEVNLSSHSRAGVRHALSHGAVYRLAHDSDVVDIAREILGTEPVAFRATLFDKSMRTNWLVAWHQDKALPLQAKADLPGWGPWSVKSGITYAHAPTWALEQVVALRIHLDDSTALNGPLRVLPGTHKLGVLSDDSVHEIAAKASPVECPVPCGGLLAMRPLLIHASSKCRTDARRRVLHIEYSTLFLSQQIELAIA